MTAEFRETVRRVLYDNRDNIGVWLAQVASENPGKALDIIAKLADFAAPRLARTELTGKNGSPVVVAVDRIDEQA